MAIRRVTYRLYPSATQLALLNERKALYQRLYNTGLEEIIRIYQTFGASVSFAELCEMLTQWRGYCDALSDLNAQSCQVVLKRLHLAMQAFFRRVKAGDKPGFPRFKSFNRFPGWGYKSYGDGWKLIDDASPSLKHMQHPHLHLSGIGKIKMRGKARTGGLPKTCDIFQKGDYWYASITVECQPKRAGGQRAAGGDWGTKEFLTVAFLDGEVREIDNPRITKQYADELAEAQRAHAHKQKGSKNCRKSAKQIGKVHRRAANRRKEFNHQASAKLINECALFAAEKLNVKNMTASAKGTVEAPGKNVAQKAGLNREILSTAPAQFFSMVLYKAEEARTLYWETPTRKLKPTQRCSECWGIVKKRLDERRHVCQCGADLGRDINSAWVNLYWALFGDPAGQELSEVRNSRTFQNETPPISA